MTGPGEHEPGAMNDEEVRAATDDLQRIREQLQAAAHGDAGSQEARDVQDALAAYWREHEPALRAAATSMTEEVRLRALDELYKWREQLNAQLQRAPGEGATMPHEVDEGHAPPRRSPQ